MSPSGGAIAKGARPRASPPIGRMISTTLDLAERLTNLPPASEVYDSSSGRGEGGCCGAASIMGDSMVTTPNQISEAMYLQQEWLGGSTACSSGGAAAAADGTSTLGDAGISPTSVAAFPASKDEKGAEGGTNSSTQNIDHTRFFAGDEWNAPQETTSLEMPSQTTSKRKKKSDDLLAQMHKTRFLTNSVLSKKKCCVESSMSSRASVNEEKAASRSIARPDADFVGGENIPDKEAPTQQQLQVPDTHSATCTLEHQHGNNNLSSEECVEVKRTSDTIDDVLLGTSSHGCRSGAEGVGNEVVITRVQSPRPFAAIEVCDDAGTSSSFDQSASTQPGLLPRPTRPQNVKNRATSSGSQSRKERRVQEVLGSLTFDVPASAIVAESRAVPLDRFSSLARSSMIEKATCVVEEDELFYDSDPGVVSVRRNSLASLAFEVCGYCSEEEGTIISTVPTESGVHLLSMNNSFDDESSLDAMYQLREDEVRNVLEVSAYGAVCFGIGCKLNSNACQILHCLANIIPFVSQYPTQDVSSRRMELIWHPTKSLSHQARFDGHTAPLRCTAWINSQDESKPTFTWNPCDPHSIMSPERLQASKNAPYDIDLSGVLRVDAVDKVDRAQHPFGRSKNSFTVQTKSGVFFFQAPSRADRDKDMRAIQLLLARIESTKQPSPAVAKDGGALRDSMMVITIEDPHEDDFIDNVNAGIEVVLPYDDSDLSKIFSY